MSRWLRILAVASVLVVLPVQPAKACSCAYGDPRDMFSGADGAMVGTFVESHPVEEPSSSDADTVYTFLLEEEHKGELGEPGGTVEVHAPLSGASCGIEATPGERYGLFLHTRDTDGAWTSSLCSQVSPQTMREAASPLPEPVSDRPVRFVAGGSFGDTQTLFLDAAGDTVAYGPGDRDVTHLDGCKGAARIVEVGMTYPDAPRLVVRDVSSLDVVSSVDLPIGRRQRFRSMSVGGLHCAARDGGRVVVFASDYAYPRARSVLLTVEDGEVDVLHEGSAHDVAFGGAVAYLREGKGGRQLTRVALDDWTERFVTRLSGRISTRIALSPDGRNLAFAASQRDVAGERTRKIVLVDTRSGTVRARVLGSGGAGDVVWQSGERLVMFGRPARVFDLDLRTRGRFDGWDAHVSAISGRTGFGVDFEGRLYEVRLPDGSPRVVRRLPSPVVYALVAL